MTAKCTRMALVFVISIGLAGCSEPEQYSEVSRDQLNHYAGIETHDHPVENSTASSAEKGVAGKDQDRR